MFNGFEKPVYWYTNEANINESKSTETNEVFYIPTRFQKRFMGMQVLYEWLFIKFKIIKINNKLIKIAISYATCISNIRREN